MSAKKKLELHVNVERDIMTFTTKEGQPYHITAFPEDIGGYVMLPGDPERVLEIAKHLDEAREITFHREYRVWTGSLNGEKVSVCSTGIGGPSTAIAVEELANLGAHTFLRVGSSGAIQEEINCGDIVISVAAVRHDGTSDRYVELAYPAYAHYEVTLALVEAAEKLGHPYHLGITLSSSSFYVGEGRPSYGGYFPSHAQTLIKDLQTAKVANVEMESATLFPLASIFGLRAGGTCAVYDNITTGQIEIKGQKENIEVGVEALRNLIKWDRIKNNKGKTHLYLSLLAK
ncbi:MAG: uridine phosphorylase [Candidatus Geothermarchaeales archaeon]